LGGLGWLQASSSFWESLEDVSVFSVRVLPAHLWRELQYLVFTNLNYHVMRSSHVTLLLSFWEKRLVKFRFVEYC